MTVLNQAKDVLTAGATMLLAREIRRIAGYTVAMADATANRVFSADADAE